MNLYDRLRDDLKAKLAISSKEYPDAVRGIIKSLKANKYPLDLTYYQVMDLDVFAEVETNHYTDVKSYFND